MITKDSVLRWLEEFGRVSRVMFALAVVGFVLVVTQFVASLSREKAIDQERADVVEQLSLIRARLEGEINSTLYLTRGMISYVATHPELTWNDFEPMATEMVTTGRHIRNLALAPDNVIEFIYPLVGNERALGMNYRDNPQQWPAVKRAIELGNTIVAGPINLVQGGQGLIARSPIYIQDRTAYPAVPPVYWGMAAIVMDTPSLFNAAGVCGGHWRYARCAEGPRWPRCGWRCVPWRCEVVFHPRYDHSNDQPAERIVADGGDAGGRMGRVR